MMNNNSKNKIVLCEIFHPVIHGFPEKENKEVLGNWVVIEKFNNIYSLEELEQTDFYDDEDYEYNDDNPCQDILDLHKAKYVSYIESNIFTRKKHPFIRNYLHIVSNPEYIKFQIAEIVFINNNNDDLLYYSVAIQKTFWLRIVQRKWKNIFHQRKKVLSLRCNIKSLQYREIHGSWPSYCKIFPEYIGMLSNLS